MKTKTIFLILGLTVLLLVILLVQQLTKTGNQPGVNPVIYFQNSPSPTSFNGLNNKPAFAILSMPNIASPIGVNDALTVKFNSPVNNETLKVTVEPQAGILPRFSDDLTVLQIMPVNTWRYDTVYNVKIYNDTQSSDGQQLDKDYQFSFKTKPYVGI